MRPPEPPAIAAEILRLTASRGPGHSVSPNDVARSLAAGDEAAWRSLLGPVRQAAMALAAEGRLEILRKGRAVPAAEARGVIRLRQPGGSAAA